FAARQIERAIIELDHVTFIDQPAQVGRERKAACLCMFARAIANQPFEELFASASWRRCQRFKDRIHGWRYSSLFISKRAWANWRDKQHAAAMPKNVQAILSKPAGQLLHHV